MEKQNKNNKRTNETTPPTTTPPQTKKMEHKQTSNKETVHRQTKPNPTKPQTVPSPRTPGKSLRAPSALLGGAPEVKRRDVPGCANREHPRTGQGGLPGAPQADTSCTGQPTPSRIHLEPLRARAFPGDHPASPSPGGAGHELLGRPSSAIPSTEVPSLLNVNYSPKLGAPGTIVPGF